MIDVRFRRTQAMAAMLQDFYTEPSSPPTIAAPLAGAWPSFKADNAALEPSARKDLLAAIPHLRAFAISLTSDRDRADDLLQDTIVRALSQFARFEPGTNLRAWMFTILRNQFYSNHRRRHREVEDADGLFAARLSTLPEQDGHLDIRDLGTALAQLSPEQREAILLVGAEGYSYEAAAAICGSKVGTLKSRVNRARMHLAELLGFGAEDIGPDRVSHAAVSNQATAR